MKDPKVKGNISVEWVQEESQQWKHENNVRNLPHESKKIFSGKSK